MSHSYQITSIEQYNSEYQKSIQDPEGFWAGVADQFLWKKKWEKVLDWNFTEPSIKWFAGGKLNITENCLDRHLEKFGNSPAIIWESNDPEEHHRSITYKDLYNKVNQ